MKEYLLKQPKATCVLFSIACKIILGLVKIMEIQAGGGSLALEIRVGGGSQWSRKSRWEGGSKNLAIRRGCVDFFWNNPLIFCIYLMNRSEMDSVPHFLKHHTFICARRALAESVTLSGLTKNFPWIFAIYHRYLAFLKFEDSIVYCFKNIRLQSCSFVIAWIDVWVSRFNFIVQF